MLRREFHLFFFLGCWLPIGRRFFFVFFWLFWYPLPGAGIPTVHVSAPSISDINNPFLFSGSLYVTIHWRPRPQTNKTTKKKGDRFFSYILFTFIKLWYIIIYSREREEGFHNIAHQERNTSPAPPSYSCRSWRMRPTGRTEWRVSLQLPIHASKANSNPWWKSRSYYYNT